MTINSQRRSIDRIRDKKQHEYELKIKAEQESLMRKEKLKTLEVNSTID